MDRTGGKRAQAGADASMCQGVYGTIYAGNVRSGCHGGVWWLQIAPSAPNTWKTFAGGGGRGGGEGGGLAVRNGGERSRPIRVLIASRVRVYREALAEVLSRSQPLCVVGTAADVGEVLERLTEDHVDIVLLDATVELPQAVSQIRQRATNVQVVALAVPQAEEDVIRLAEAGVAGYVLPDGSTEELIVALESAARGELRVSPRVAYRLLRRLGSLATLVQGQEPGPPAELTAREREIIELIHQGMTNKDIARRLGIETGTAKNHVHNILRKLHTHRRINAAEWFRKGGFHLKLEA